MRGVVGSGSVVGKVVGSVVSNVVSNVVGSVVSNVFGRLLRLHGVEECLCGDWARGRHKVDTKRGLHVTADLDGLVQRGVRERDAQRGRGG